MIKINKHKNCTMFLTFNDKTECYDCGEINLEHLKGGVYKKENELNYLILSKAITSYARNILIKAKSNA